MTAASSAWAAFGAADFRDATDDTDVWTDRLFHVDALHGDLSDRITAEFFARTRTEETNPLGLALSGPAGAGKSHLLSILRRRVCDGGGWFVRIDLSVLNGFWNTVASEYSASLSRRMANGRTQASAILLALLARLKADATARGVLVGKASAAGVRTGAVDLLLTMLTAVDTAATQRWQDVVRALALCDSRNASNLAFATAWLQGSAIDESRLRELRFSSSPPETSEIVRGLLWILSLGGPTLVAIEGIDALVARASSSRGEVADPAILKTLVRGLLAFHDVKRRSMTILACREESLEVLFEMTALAAAFRRTRMPHTLDSAELVERLVVARLTPAYAKADFSPPYPTFPFTRQAIASAAGISPRDLLRRCREHQQVCHREAEIRECASLAEAPVEPSRPEDSPETPSLAAPGPVRQSEIFVGRSAQIGEVVGPVAMRSELLPQHIAVLAAQGKGALLNRFIQEAALAGTSALVLDLYGDFARLGEPWPSRPTEFSADDARKAKEYFERVETELWTPGLSSGRPLALSVLPAFGALRRGGEPDSLEARELAIEMAAAALESHLPARGPRAIRLRGALVDALRVFVRDGGGSLDDFLRLLGRSPESVSRHMEASQSGREIADQLRAALSSDPLLEQSGEPLDPERLFEGTPGKTRISVIHLGGLADDARAAFVHRLNMALFCSIRNRPDWSGRLVVLDDAHLFASGKEITAARRSALTLAKQATKSGLGLIFASQAPCALDPGIIGVCRTRLYGSQGSPPDAAAITELMSTSGAAGADLAQLKSGEFFFSDEMHPRPIKLRASLSLSRRTLNLPTSLEIAAIARRGPKAILPAEPA